MKIRPSFRDAKQTVRYWLLNFRGMIKLGNLTFIHRVTQTMFGNLFGKSSNRKSSKGLSPAASDALQKAIPGFIYRYCFDELPRKFFGDLVQFQHETTKQRALAHWSQGNLSSNTIIYIANFTAHPAGDSGRRALFVAALYDTAAQQPSRFFVLCDTLGTKTIREVRSDLSSSAVSYDVSCNPDTDSFASLIPSLIS